MHKYAMQMTVADARDGALSGSTLKEASSWGKVDLAYEQMVFSEATLAVPLIVGYAYHKGSWSARKAKQWAALLDAEAGAPAQAAEKNGAHGKAKSKADKKAKKAGKK